MKSPSCRPIPSGVQASCNAAKQAVGESDDAMTTKSLEQFFEVKRPASQTLQEYDVKCTLCYEEANQRAGLEINDVAKSYLWLCHSGLSQKHQDDLKLQIHGNMSRFGDLRVLALCLSHTASRSNPTGGDVFYEADEGWNDDGDYGPGTNQEDDFYYDSRYGEELRRRRMGSRSS